MNREETLIKYGGEIFNNLIHKKTLANLKEIEETEQEAIKQIYNDFNSLLFKEEEKDYVEKGIIEEAEEYKRNL
jgi:hypothetical protein